MAEAPEGGTAVLRRLKPKLIEVLSGESDHVLQHADSLSLLSPREYRRLKAIDDPSQKIRDLLDYVIQKGHSPALSFLEFLREADTRNTFPQLSVILERVELLQEPQEQPTKRKTEEPVVEISSKKKKLEAGSGLVSERQMMLVAREVGRDWKQLGRLALDIPSVRLEQIEEDNPADLRERVFAMLRVWRTREGQDATAARLHALLSADKCAPPADKIDFLLDPV
ncbi:uncharacterized protein zgc:174906 [Conger conger]|uniref:uncharacterized protein zgc:174906 n=1 Tax=Conger conger TaxID=82655 RepID=UPI002A5A0AC3|nr:uncharacterized protein zgc:174906 [Conger conger]XP_061114822.1 uncharacterized protein zgc:174906 [Conger conger]XP_061114823.1 uncharacterized protein zgc:174906 [Conger conger]XP_061114824.1 uncharacterized protein zgc:174906 [Conger conger]XP_061114825.1 uncharacterized protein zgc:174906 [Conger conger]